MRYAESGQVHIDFHRTTNGTIAYLRETYGDDFLDETFRRMARCVYKSIHEDLKRGDWAQLMEHWRHFFDREGGECEVRATDTEATFVVHRCPAIAHLRRRGIKIDPAFCRQTSVVNCALAEGTPFEIETNVLGDGKCVQTVRRKA